MGISTMGDLRKLYSYCTIHCYLKTTKCIKQLTLYYKKYESLKLVRLLLNVQCLLSDHFLNTIRLAESVKCYFY